MLLIVVQLSIEVYDPNVIPATLSLTKNNYLFGKMVIAAGWGINNRGLMNRYLQKSIMYVLTNNERKFRVEVVQGEKKPVDVSLICTATRHYDKYALLNCVSIVTVSYE